MSDLVVKFHLLEDSQTALKSIMTEFDKNEDNVGKLDDIWSNGHVQDAMHSFASDWKDHKEKLLQKMDDAYKHTEKCIENFQKSDQGLANSVTMHNNPAGGAGHSHPGAN